MEGGRGGKEAGVAVREGHRRTNEGIEPLSRAQLLKPYPPDVWLLAQTSDLVGHMTPSSWAAVQVCGHFDIHSQELSLYKNQKHSRKGRKEYVKENRFTPKPYRLALCSSYEGLLETACDTLFTTALRVLASAAVGLQVGSGLPCSLDLLQSLLLLWPHSNTAVVEVTINGGREHWFMLVLPQGYDEAGSGSAERCWWMEWIAAAVRVTTHCWDDSHRNKQIEWAYPFSVLVFQSPSMPLVVESNRKLAAEEK